MLRPLLLTFTLSFFCQPAFAVTLHFDMTPELAGDKGVTMKQRAKEFLHDIRPQDFSKIEFPLELLSPDTDEPKLP